MVGDMTQTLKVPGAELYYEVRGNGPWLLIGQSGDGDADRSADLVEQLVDHFTVISYDRRGLSRSPLTYRNQPVSPETHADGSHGAWNYQCAEILAGLVRSEVVEFPGGHNGNTMFPRAFAARLVDVLETARPLPAGGAVGG
jgi:hypothetical protein